MTFGIDSIVNFVDRETFRISRKIGKFKLCLSRNRRPSSYPYLSGDTFRAISNHVHDETNDLSPLCVKKGGSVFVSQERLLPFLKDVHPHIKHQYVLICHNGDGPHVNAEITNLIDDKIVHFFAQLVTEDHPKVTPIPIGLENRHLCHAGVISRIDTLRRKLSKINPIRKNKILFSFSIHTNPAERRPARDLFSKISIMEAPSQFLTPRRHNHELITYKFVASPPGNSIESCRTWEALYLKTIPIVKNYAAFRHFAALGLPLWIVNDWQELKNVTEEDLSKRYEEMIKQADWSPLHMDYWINQIELAKAKAEY
jgi:hypothetical protein